MALVRCILDKFLGVACHCFPPKVQYVKIIQPTYIVFFLNSIHIINELHHTNFSNKHYISFAVYFIYNTPS